jgi:hypothetical protein
METICDPCSGKNKRLVAEKYCSDCEEIYIPYTAYAIQRILCIAFLHSPNNIFQQQAFCFFLNMDHKLFPFASYFCKLPPLMSTANTGYPFPV